jgi:hypothetical protein
LLEGVEACSEDADWERVPGVQSSEAPAKQSATMGFFMMCSLYFCRSFGCVQNCAHGRLVVKPVLLPVGSPLVVALGAIHFSGLDG